MMKNKPFVLLALFSVLAMVSCQSPVANSTKAVSGSGRVAVAVHAPSRTLVADAASAVTGYTVTLTSHDGADPINAEIASGAGAASFDAVPAGTWDLDVTAYADQTVVGLGSLNNQIVTDGGSLEVTIPVTTTQTGAGGFHFAFSLPAEVAVNAVSAQLYQTEAASGVESAFGDPMVPELTISGTEVLGALSNADLPSGAYRLKLTFRRGGAAGEVVKVDTEAVNVFDNLTSDLWLDPAGQLQSRKAYTVADFMAKSLYNVTAQRGWTGAGDTLVSILVNGPADSTYAVYHHIFATYPAAGTVRDQIVQFDSNHTDLRHIDIPDIDISDITVDTNGNLYVVGNFNIDNTVQTQSIGTDSTGNDVSFSGYTGLHPLLVKLNPAGQIVWARSASLSSGAGNAGFNAVVVSGSGTVDVVGYTMQASPYDFGNNVQAEAPQSENALLVQYDADGQALWARTQATGVVGMSYFQSLGLDGEDNIYVGGELTGQDDYTFAGSGTDTPITVTLTSTVPDDFGNDFVVSGLVLVKYSPTGTPIWANTTVTTTGNSISKVAVDASGNLFAIGGLGAGPTDFGTNASSQNYTFNPTVNGAPFLAKYDAAGQIQWVSSAATAGAQVYLSNLVLGAQGEITVVGSVYGSAAVSFSGPSVTGGYTAQNALVVRYDSSGSALWARVASVAPHSSEYEAVVSDSAGRILAGGYQAGNGSFGYGDGITLAGTGTDYTSVLVQYQ